ncbi:MAG: MBL fold metallo-hydrolase [Clostridiales bacterium]|nr:MBL fold metallo-hydrolase [Clostridiales bacterium]
MRITWLGHACFKLTSDSGVSVITDPFDERVGYDLPKESADIVTVSHQHYDHNYIEAVEGSPQVIDKAGDFSIKAISIKGIKSYHDDKSGSERGSNIIYKIEMDGIKICHCGDLGHSLTREQADQLGDVDVLLVPVGGTYTVDAKTAADIVGVLNPSLIIPMHFKTDRIDFPIDGVDKFLEIMGEGTKMNTNTLEVTEQDIQEKGTRVVVLDYKK